MSITTVYWKTSDLAIATTLSLYVSIIEIDKANPRKAEFVFIRTKKIDALIDRYWKKELLVEPRTYFDHLKAVKNRLYSSE